MVGLKTAALDSLLLKRGSPLVGRKAALRVHSAGGQPGSRSLLVAFGFYSPPDESNKVGRTRQTCNATLLIRGPFASAPRERGWQVWRNSRVSQEEQVEHRVVFAEVD